MKRFKPSPWMLTSFVLAAFSLFLIYRQKTAGNATDRLPDSDYQDSLANAPLGLWHAVDENDSTSGGTSDLQKRIKSLEAIGYLSGSVEAPDDKGVTLHDKNSAYPGLNLYTSGHAPEAILLTMDGEEIHRWRHDFDRVWPDAETPLGAFPRHRAYWRRAHLFEDGDILAIFEGYGMIRLDKDSNLRWAYPGKCHHDMHVSKDGLIFTLARKGEVLPAVNKTDPILNDYVVVLDMDGIELNRFSILDCFRNARYRPFLMRMSRQGDVFHTNTIEVLDGRLAPQNPAFSRGNLLISIRELDTIAVIDPEAKKAVWMLDGMWSRQHQPTILENGNMLIFDNRGNRGLSRVLEFDAFTQQVVWRYGESLDERLCSKTCGSCQRLPNGNTLITESDQGRALEVTVDGKIVWEFRNPHRAGDNEELIATLFEMVRLPANFMSNP